MTNYYRGNRRRLAEAVEARDLRQFKGCDFAHDYPTDRERGQGPLHKSFYSKFRAFIKNICSRNGWELVECLNHWSVDEVTAVVDNRCGKKAAITVPHLDCRNDAWYECVIIVVNGEEFTGISIDDLEDEMRRLLSGYTRQYEALRCKNTHHRARLHEKYEKYIDKADEADEILDDVYKDLSKFYRYIGDNFPGYYSKHIYDLYASFHDVDAGITKLRQWLDDFRAGKFDDSDDIYGENPYSDAQYAKKVENSKNYEADDYSSYSAATGWGLTKDQLILWLNKYKTATPEQKQWIEDMLDDINYHYEAGQIANGNVDALINDINNPNSSRYSYYYE